MLTYRKLLSFLSGGVAVAISSLVIALLLLKEDGAEAFAVFSLYQLTWTFSLSASTAILSTSVLNLWSEDGENREHGVKSYFLANTLYSFLAASLQAIIVYASSSSITAAIAYGLATGFGVFRWFIRSFMNIAGENDYVGRSDTLFSISSLSLVGISYFSGFFSLEYVGFCLVAANIFSLVFLGAGTWGPFFHGQLSAGLEPFWEGFRKRGGYACIAAVCTDILNNSYAYIITFLYGAAAYAPVAFAYLLYRPAVLAYSTITPLIRPRLLGILQKKDRSAIDRFTSIYIAGFSSLIVMNGVAGYFLSPFIPDSMSVFEGDRGDLTALLLVFGLVLLLRLSRTALSLILQVGDRYRENLLSMLVGAMVYGFVVFFMGINGFSPMSIVAAMSAGEVIAAGLMLVVRQKIFSVL